MIFVDTGAFLARHFRRDQHHDLARQVWDELAESADPLVTSNFVVDETLTLIGRRAGGRFAADVGRRLYASRTLSIVRPSREVEIDALIWMEKYSDQTLSFTDCVSFVVMRERAIDRVFGFDSDFTRAGFTLVPAVRS